MATSVRSINDHTHLTMCQSFRETISDILNVYMTYCSLIVSSSSTIHFVAVFASMRVVAAKKRFESSN